MTKNVVFRMAELFCGPGGLALGATTSEIVNSDSIYSIEPVWGNDIDKDACRTYIRNIHKNDSSKVVCRPIEEVDFKNLPNFDVLAFGFPCNDFSVVGEQKGFNGRYGPLYTYGIKAVNAYNPKWFFAENVSGLQSANGGLAFQRILYDLKSAGIGYEITAHLYKFEDYGVPQCRHRVVIIGIRKDMKLKFKVPAPTTLASRVSARAAIENPPIAKDAPNNEITKQGKLVIERLKYIGPGENAWNSKIPEKLKLNVKSAKLSQIYKRLHPDKPSYTITGSGGGGTHGYHWIENRALTNRERARLQTFPDSFVFEGSKESVRRQIGMAVPPKGAQIIIEAVLKTFAGVYYDWVPEKISNGNGTKKTGVIQENLFRFEENSIYY